MTSLIKKNIAASIRQRLLNYAKENQKPFQEILQYYAMERFLYRLSQARLSTKFILKGALLLQIWHETSSRPTMDIDLLGKTNNEEKNIARLVKEIISVSVEDDGLVFLPDSVKTEQITEDSDYQGVRVRFLGKITSTRINMQIDVGFGDIVYPEPVKSRLPTILDLPSPDLFVYTKESAIAEKFEAMIHLGDLNSRMKDFYDIWLLSRQFGFEGEKLSEAIRQTFLKRETELPSTADIFSIEFAEKKQIQWLAFYNRLGQDFVPKDFIEVVKFLNKFLCPLVQLLVRKDKVCLSWDCKGKWVN